MKIFTLNNSYIEKELHDLGNHVYVFPHSRDQKGNVIVVEKKLYKIIKTRQPDIFYYNKMTALPLHVLKELREVTPKTKFVFWLGDQRGKPHPIIEERVGYIDLLLLNNDDFIQFIKYQDIGISDVRPFYDSIDPNEFYYIDKTPKYDIVFGGNNFKHHRFPLGKFRYDLLNEINSRFNLAVHGEGWNFETKKRVRGEAYNKVLNTGHITLGCNHYDTRAYYEERLWQCMGSGRMHLTRYIPGMENIFTNHTHLVWFKDIDECCDLISYYRKNVSKCEAIGKCGREFLIKHHTHTCRIRQLQKYFKEIKCQ